MSLATLIQMAILSHPVPKGASAHGRAARSACKLHVPSHRIRHSGFPPTLTSLFVTRHRMRIPGYELKMLAAGTRGRSRGQGSNLFIHDMPSQLFEFSYAFQAFSARLKDPYLTPTSPNTRPARCKFKQRTWPAALQNESNADKDLRLQRNNNDRRLCDSLPLSLSAQGFC